MLKVIGKKKCVCNEEVLRHIGQSELRHGSVQIPCPLPPLPLPLLAVTEQIPSKASYKINTLSSTYSFSIHLNQFIPIQDGCRTFKRTVGTNTTQCENVKYNGIFLSSP